MLASGEEGRSRGTACVGETTCWEIPSDETFSSDSESPSSESSLSIRKGSGISASMNNDGLVAVGSEGEESCSWRFDWGSSCGKWCSSDMSMCVVEESTEMERSME